MSGKTCDRCRTKFKPDDLSYLIETSIEDNYKHSHGVRLNRFYLCQSCIETTRLQPVLDEIKRTRGIS